MTSTDAAGNTSDAATKNVIISKEYSYAIDAVATDDIINATEFVTYSTNGLTISGDIAEHSAIQTFVFRIRNLNTQSVNACTELLMPHIIQKQSYWVQLNGQTPCLQVACLLGWMVITVLKFTVLRSNRILHRLWLTVPL